MLDVGTVGTEAPRGMTVNGLGTPRRNDLWIGLALAVASAVVHLLYFRHGVQNLVDLGVACVDADRILDGQLSGRDFFESYGPGRFYLTALAYLLGGTSLLSFSVLCLILLAVKDFFVYLASRYVLSPAGAIFVTLTTIIVHGPIHKVFLTLGAVLVIHGALALIRAPTRGRALRFGIVTLIAGLLRYDMGAAGILIAFLAVPLAAERRHALAFVPSTGALAASYLAGVIIPTMLVVGFFLVQGADPLNLLRHHLVRLHSLELANQDAPGIMGLFSAELMEQVLFGWILVLFAAVYLLAAILAAVRFRKATKGTANFSSLLILLVISMLVFNQVRLGVKFSRFSQVIPPFIMLFMVLIEAGWHAAAAPGRRWLRVFPTLIAAGLLAAFLTFIWTTQGYYSQDSFAVLRLKRHYLNTPRGQCYFKKDKGAELEALIRYIQGVTEPGEPIFTGPSCPLVNFLCDRPNPTPFTDFTFYYFDEANQRLVIHALERAKVKYAVNWPRPLTGFLFDDCAPLVANYLRSAFKVERRIGRFEILRKVE